jgi:hypothetical protein
MASHRRGEKEKNQHTVDLSDIVLGEWVHARFPKLVVAVTNLYNSFLNRNKLNMVAFVVRRERVSEREQLRRFLPPFESCQRLCCRWNG